MSAKRPPLSRASILEAAVALADERGLAKLSMRALAQSVGVEAMSLYNHIKNKDDVLDGMVEVVVAKIARPQVGGDWQAAIRARAHAAHAVLLAHPWATQLFMSRINVGPAMLAYVDATIGCFREAGFSMADTDHAWNAVDNHIYGFTLQALNFPFQPDEYAAAAEAYLPLVPRKTVPHLHAMTCAVIAGEHTGIRDFSFGLELILDGLARRLT